MCVNSDCLDTGEFMMLRSVIKHPLTKPSISTFPKVYTFVSVTPDVKMHHLKPNC